MTGSFKAVKKGIKSRFTIWEAFAYILIFFAIALAIWFLYYGDYFTGSFAHPDNIKISAIEPFMVGVVLPVLTLGSTLLVVENIRSSTLQNFSTNFLKLIDHHHVLLDNINAKVYSTKNSTGKEVFSDLAEIIAKDYRELSNNNSAGGLNIAEALKSKAKGKEGKELLVIIYSHYFEIFQSDLGHYFRNLYYIVLFVERSSIQKKHKIAFLGMLRANLSNYEILLLAYNGLHEYGENFFPLIVKYELLKSLNNEEELPIGTVKRIIDIDILKKEYPQFNGWQKREVVVENKTIKSTSKPKGKKAKKDNP